jgi:hypothetical protein
MSKKTPCKFFNSRGGCHRADSCTFAHTQADSSGGGAAAASPPPPSTHVQQGKVFCKYFQRIGNCRNGDTCTFVHAKEKISLSSAAPEFSPDEKPISPSSDATGGRGGSSARGGGRGGGAPRGASSRGRGGGAPGGAPGGARGGRGGARGGARGGGRGRGGGGRGRGGARGDDNDKRWVPLPPSWHDVCQFGCYRYFMGRACGCSKSKPKGLKGVLVFDHGRTLCFHYALKGECPYGDQCRYGGTDHSIERVLHVEICACHSDSKRVPKLVVGLMEIECVNHTALGTGQITPTQMPEPEPQEEDEIPHESDCQCEECTKEAEC